MNASKNIIPMKGKVRPTTVVAISSCLYFVGRIRVLTSLFESALRREFWPTSEIVTEWITTLDELLRKASEPLSLVLAPFKGMERDEFFGKNWIYLVFFNRQVDEAERVLATVRCESDVLPALGAALDSITMAHQSLVVWQEYLAREHPTTETDERIVFNDETKKGISAAIATVEASFRKAIIRRRDADQSLIEILDQLDLVICRESRKYFLILFHTAAVHDGFWTHKEQKKAVGLLDEAISVMGEGEAREHTQLRLDELRLLTPSKFDELSSLTHRKVS